VSSWKLVGRELLQGQMQWQRDGIVKLGAIISKAFNFETTDQDFIAI
jgi:hypothetical protein